MQKNTTDAFLDGFGALGWLLEPPQRPGSNENLILQSAPLEAVASRDYEVEPFEERFFRILDLDDREGHAGIASLLARLVTNTTAVILSPLLSLLFLSKVLSDHSLKIAHPAISYAGVGLGREYGALALSMVLSYYVIKVVALLLWSSVVMPIMDRRIKHH